MRRSLETIIDLFSDCGGCRRGRNASHDAHFGHHPLRGNQCPAMPPQGVRLNVQDHHVLMDNGIVQVTLTKPGGIVTGVRYGGIDNLLEVLNKETNRGYWDIHWNQIGGKGIFDVIQGTIFRVIVENEDQVELSFVRTWDPSLEGRYIPLNIDKRFILLRGSSGFYSYAIYEHLQEWPGFELGETRITFKLRKDKFCYMAMADNRQRYMPLPDDRLPGRCQPLAYQEAVLLVNPVDPRLRGEVDDKYQYSCENENLNIHGWISFEPPVGFWQITPSNEFRSGGPLKQNLTSHVGPTALAMFHSAHYAGKYMVPRFEPGESWKKVFGPVFIYFNSATRGEDPLWLWEEAKIQMMAEVQNWPYSFPAAEDFQKSEQRGTVSGRLLVRDRYICDDCAIGAGAYVGLACPGTPGSWELECKNYQFWTRADENGFFTIRNICTGDYNLYAWVPGFIGDFRNEVILTINSGIILIPHVFLERVAKEMENIMTSAELRTGCNIEIGNVIFEPPRDGPTLWEIGIPDRSAAEFYVPDPDPKYINKLFVNHPDRFRQYGLWERYMDLYPDEDLVYTVGVSDYRRDWFYVHGVRKVGDSHQGTTWQIKFNLENVDKGGTYKLRVAIASATLAELQVRVNNPNTNRPLFTTGLIGRDNAIARHGIHGVYRLYHVDIPGAQFVIGENTIFLRQPRWSSPFVGIMYDYIRLEGPPTSSPC